MTDQAMPSLLARVAIVVIDGYKRFLSPLLGRHCRFHPTCSTYARDAIARHGVARGGLMGAARLCRCQPLADGGLDPVPAVFKRDFWRKNRSPSDAAE